MDKETLHLHYTFHHDGAMSAANSKYVLTNLGNEFFNKSSGDQ